MCTAACVAAHPASPPLHVELHLTSRRPAKAVRRQCARARNLNDHHNTCSNHGDHTHKSDAPHPPRRHGSPESTRQPHDNEHDETTGPPEDQLLPANTFVSQMVVRLHNSISLVMRYGKSSGVLEIDPAVRRSSGQSLKKAAPGAPFGWTSEGTPYIGTQYCIQASPQGFKFASLSTRNGNSNYYWKPLNGLSATVALSALETHGAVDHLCAGESRLPLRDIMSPVQIAKVRAVFVGLLGADVVASFESVADTPDAPLSAPSSEVKPEVKEDASEEKQRSRTGEKRKARMAMVDEIKRTKQSEDRHGGKRATAKSTSEPQPEAAD